VSEFNAPPDTNEVISIAWLRVTKITKGQEKESTQHRQRCVTITTSSRTNTCA